MASDLASVARRCDEMATRARTDLVAAVRQAAAQGVSQREIARQIGRSQPEVSRLLRFHGTSPLGIVLRARAREVRRLIAEAGGDNVRVFGSVAAGSDGPDSDVDLVFSMKRPLSLMDLGRLEAAVATAVGVDVDLVPESALRPDLRERVLRESVPL